MAVSSLLRLPGAPRAPRGPPGRTRPPPSRPDGTAAGEGSRHNAPSRSFPQEGSPFGWPSRRRYVGGRRDSRSAAEKPARYHGLGSTIHLPPEGSRREALFSEEGAADEATIERWRITEARRDPPAARPRENGQDWRGSVRLGLRAKCGIAVTADVRGERKSRGRDARARGLAGSGRRRRRAAPPRRLYPEVRDAVATVQSVDRLRWEFGFSHVEPMSCWIAQPVAGGRPQRRTGGHDGLHRRPGRPRPAGVGRRRDALAGDATGDVARHAAPASRVGVRLPPRVADGGGCSAATSSRRVGAGCPR